MTEETNANAYAIAQKLQMMPQPAGKYEPHYNEDGTKYYTFANYHDASNICIKFYPETSYNITGTLTPDAAGSYSSESQHEGAPSYANSLRTFFVWWDGVDSWIVSDEIGNIENPYWKRTDPAIVGDYTPQNAAVGTATIASP
jgi:hypothetical protein